MNALENRACFVINRLSGRGYRQNLERQILDHCRQSNQQPVLKFTGYRGHATELAAQAAADGCPTVFAVGGDGTVNEVAKALAHTGAAMGIIPSGSGNGLAKHLNIPMNPAKALSLLQEHRTIHLDALLINDRYAFNVCGIGFDGYVASLFGQNGKRGLSGYVGIILREFFKFDEFRLAAQIDGRDLQERAFIVAVANSSQFGNGATIAPAASVCDGLMDICLIRKPPFLKTINFLVRLFTRQLHRSSLVQIIQATEFRISLEQPIACHVDGEPFGSASHLSISLVPACLKMLVPAAARRI